MHLQSSISIALVGLAAVYSFTIILLLIGLFRLKRGGNHKLHRVSVIVAARNEEENLGRCLCSLVSQDYPQDKYEIIVVDDRSTDSTPEIVRRCADEHLNVRLLQVGENRKHSCPKKNALEIGITSSGGEIIFLTDADCMPKSSWISGMIQYFEPEVGLVAGYSPFESEKGILQKLISLESLSTAVLSAGSTGIGLPLACTARNLAYRRSVFEEVDGFSRIGHIISGDDVLFLKLVDEKTDWRIRYSISDESFVPTKLPCTKLRKLFHQKVRHCSKAVYYSSPILVLASLIYLFHLMLLITVPLSLLRFKDFMIPLLVIGAKAFSDILALLKGAKLFGKGRLLSYFPLFEVLYVPYIAIFSALGCLGSFRWKD